MTDWPHILQGIGGICLFAAAGWGLTEMEPHARSRGVLIRLAYSYLLGLSWVAVTLYALSHVLKVPLGRPAVLLPLAVSSLAGLASRYWRRRPETTPSERNDVPPSFRFLRGLTLTITALASVALLGDAVTQPMTDWDGRMHWSMQARLIRAERTVDARVLREPVWFVSHPRYPLLLPLAQVAVLETFGAEDERVPRPLYAAFYPSLILVLYDASRRLAGCRPAILATLCAAVLPALTLESTGGASTSYSDVPLACFLGAALALLLVPATMSTRLFAGVLLGAAVLTKNEGLPLSILVLAVAFGPGLARALGRHRVPGKRARLPQAAEFAAFLPVALATALLFSWRAPIPNRFDEKYELQFGLAAAFDGLLSNGPRVLEVVLVQLRSLEAWGIFWWVVPLVLLAGRRAFRRRAARQMIPLVLGPPTLAWGAYLVHWDPVWLATVTWNRCLVIATVPLFVLLAMALREALRKPVAAPETGNPPITSRPPCVSTAPVG